jgi:uncharacterized membrane protein YdjX (TVP38/TMEM64 family)
LVDDTLTIFDGDVAARAMHGRWVKRVRKRHWVMLGVSVAVIAAAAVLLADRYDLRVHMARVVQMVRDAGPVPFFTAMALLPAVGFPLSGFTLVAAPVFAPTIGLGMVVVCALVAITANVALSYWLASSAMRPVAEWVVRKLGYRLPVVDAKTAWMAILVLRIVPLTPFSLQGILLGLARVPFGPYMLVSVTIPSVYAVAVITLGDALMRGDPWAIGGAAVLFVVIGVVLHILRKRFQADSAAALKVKDET